MDTGDDYQKRALLQWLLHIVTTSSWHTARFSLDDLPTTIMEACLITPGFWSNKLAKAILNLSDNEFKQLWEPLLEVSFFNGRGAVDNPLSSLSEVSSRDTSLVTRIGAENMLSRNAHQQEMSQGLDDAVSSHSTGPMYVQTEEMGATPTRASGWKLWEGGWIPKPIGVTHSYQTEE